MTTRIKLRRDTAANWLTSNPILAAGEPGLETDTGKVKYGDGVTTWTNLPHAGGDTLNDEGGVVVTTGSTKYWVATQRREGKDIYGRGVRYDSEGNVYAVTKTYDDSDSVAVITKYSPTGTLLWQHTIDQANPTALAVDSSNNAYIALDNNDYVNLIKFDSDGEIVWKKQYNAGNLQSEAFIEERTNTRLAMTLNRQDGGASQVLVLDINTATGDIVTQKILSNAQDNMYAAGIDTDGAGNVFVTGRYYDSGADKDKMFVEKLDGSLTRIWSKSLQTDNNYNMEAGDCASDAQGNVYAVGFYDVDTTGPNGTGDETAGVLVKLNSSGAVQWTRRLGPGPCGQSVVGLTATDVGDVYLVSQTLEFNRSNKQLNDVEQFAESTNRMLVAKYDTAGAVLWQRYIDAELVWESADTFRGQTISVFNDKFVTDFYGYSSNAVPWNFSSTDDNEADFFLIQLPTDGTNLAIGNVEFRESRIPGRFVTHEASDSPTANEAFEGSVTVNISDLALDPISRVANALIRSETYDYVFGPDGTLTIPNDGDIKLTQSQVGFFAVIGDTVNYDYDTQGRAVTADSHGNTYVVGEDDDTGKPIVVKISPEGYRLWSVAIHDDNTGNNGRANGVALHPATGNVVVACEYYGNHTYGAVITLDQDTGRILASNTYIDENNDVYLNDIVFQSTGDMVVGGSKNGNFSAETPVTALAGSAMQKIIVARSQLVGIPDQSWQIGGTGFSVFENIAAIEQYSNLSGTVDAAPGSGAQITVDNMGNGVYQIGTIPVPGTGYQVGRFLKVLGTDLGGATPDNDLILKVNAIDGNGGITGHEIVSGTAAGSVQTNYPSVPVVIIPGSGFTITSYSGPRNNSDYSNYWTYSGGNGGEKYVVGDVIRIAGTDLGGTSPANDLIVTVTGVDSNGNAYAYAFSGTAQSTNWSFITNTSVDFSQSGSWQITRPLSRENILIGDGWTRIYGTNTGDYTDRTYAIAVDSSDNIIAATQGYGKIVSEGGTYDLAVVYKFTSNGTLQWARQLNERSDDGGEAKGVTTVGTDIYVTHYSYYDGDTIITKLAADGTVKWQRRTDSGSDSSIAGCADGNLVVVAEAYNQDIGDDAIKLFKLTPNGETIYKRWLFATTENDTRFKNGRCLAVVGDSIYITSYYYADDYDSWFVARLPLDGSGTGEYSQFRYMDVNPVTGSWSYPGLSSDTNYDIGELGGTYAGALNVAPYTNSGVAGSGEGDFYVNTHYPSYFYEDIRDQDGGRIVFADGTTQNTSATDIPQRIYTGARYTLGMRDRGHHIYCQNENRNIIIPYDSRVPFPIGTTITIVNDSGSTIYIYTEGGGTQVMLPGNGYYSGFQLDTYGVATLLKIGREKWVITGNVSND